MEYKNLNDNELIYMVNEIDEEAYDLIYNKYKNVIYELAYKYSRSSLNVGIDINDLILEGNLGLESAIRDFKGDNNQTTFYTFVRVCVERKIISLIRKSTSKGNLMLNNSTYCEQEYLENIEANNENILDKIILEEDEEKKYKDITEILTDIELKVFLLKIKNYTIKEISEILNMNVKSVSNAIYRIRRKTKLLNMD